jgi:hypothetical protein
VFSSLARNELRAYYLLLAAAFAGQRRSNFWVDGSVSAVEISTSTKGSTVLRGGFFAPRLNWEPFALV